MGHGRECTAPGDTSEAQQQPSWGIKKKKGKEDLERQLHIPQCDVAQQAEEGWQRPETA
jgi:hypothetical protein